MTRKETLKSIRDQLAQRNVSIQHVENMLYWLRHAYELIEDPEDQDTLEKVIEEGEQTLEHLKGEQQEPTLPQLDSMPEGLIEGYAY